MMPIGAGHKPYGCTNICLDLQRGSVGLLGSVGSFFFLGEGAAFGWISHY